MPQIKLSIMLHISNRCAVLAMALGLMCGEADANLNLLYTIENNLPSSLVRQVEESADEMIWIATEDGLCRFDGSQFVTYTYEPNNPHSLQNNIVLTLCTDEKGHVLVGTRVGLQMYRPATDDFTEVICDSLLGIPAGNVSDITNLANGDFFVCGNTIFTCHIDENGIPHAIANPLTKKDLTSSYCCQDYSGNIWTTSTVHGVQRVDKEGNLEKIPLPEGIKGVNMLEIGPDGIVYMGGVGRGLYKYNNVTHRIEEITGPDDHFIVRELRNVPGKQRMYVCTDGEGVKVLNCRTGSLSDFNFDDAQLEVGTQKVHSLTKSKNGDIWMAIYQKGVLVISRNPFDFHYYGSHSLRYNNIGDRCVTSLFRTHDGMLCVGTDNGGVYCLDDKGETISHFPCNKGPQSVPSVLITMFEDSRHRVWFGSYGQGGGILDLKTGVCQYIPIENQRSNTSNIYDYVEDVQGNVWVGSMGNGILKYDEQRKAFVRQNLHPACDWTISLSYDRGTRQLYVGSYNGLVIVSQQGDEMKCEQYYPERVIYSISRISATKISLCSNAGLIVFDTQKRSGRIYTVEDGFPTDNFLASQADGEGNLWVSSSKGISKLNLDQHIVTNYTSREGLQFNEFYKNTSMRDENGTLWFGGTEGINWFNPSEIRKSETKVDARVVRFSTDLNNILPDKDGVYRLDEQDRSFSIELATRPIMQTFSVTYRYAMDNDAWHTLPPSDNRVMFSHLSSGSHTFRFQIDDDGTLSPEESVQIFIVRPWYLRWWALLLGVIALGSIIGLVILQIRRRYHDRKMRLKQARQAADNEEKLAFFINLAHEIRTPMTLVVSPLQKLMLQDKDPERLRSYRLIDRNANRVLGLINEIMALRKLDKAQMRLQCQQLSPAKLIEDLCETVSDLTQERQINLKYNNFLPEGFVTWIDKGCFDKIVINLLSNAIKYTPRGGYINVESSLTPDKKLGVSITDNGIGIDPEDKKHVFELFYRSNVNNPHAMGTGIGLNLVKALVTLHHGNVVAEDNPEGQGTILSFTLPTRDDAYDDKEKITKQVQNPVLEDDLDEVTIVKKSIGQTTEEPSVGSNRSARRILVVEDEDEILSYLTSELKPIYRVRTCTNGREALEKLLENADGYDLVLSDVMMPDMDGVELCRFIRSNVLLNHLPVVLLTAKTSDEDRLKSLEVGANAFITKPFNMEILLKTIKNLIDEHDRLRSSFSGSQLPADKVDTPELQSPDQRLLQRILKVVNDNLSNTELTSEDIADKVGLSRVHLYRKLRELTNQTPRSFIRNIRLAKAAELLSQRKMSIAEVAYEVGFSNPNNFATAFKEMYGMPPTAYNEKHCSGSGAQP